MVMKEVILYPTETVYALGVNPLDEAAWQLLCKMKQRSVTQPASWLVRNVAEIEQYATVTNSARALMEEYLPGPLTVILEAKETVPSFATANDGTVSFRISSDEIAQVLINTKNHPLTCTSANVHDLPTEDTPEKILHQLGEYAQFVSEVYDDGTRDGLPSTIVRCVGDETTVVRQGAIKL